MQYLRSRNSNCVLTPSKRWQKFIMAADMGLTFIVYCRMLQCGLPDEVFTILAGVHAAGGEIKEFLHLVEYFCGVASITSAWNASGMRGVGYDIEKSKIYNNMCSPAGFLYALRLLCRLAPEQGLAWFATVCSTWVWMCRNSTQRSTIKQTITSTIK